MAGLNEPSVNREYGHRFTNEQNSGVLRRIFCQKPSRFPRRYIMAIMMFIVLIIDRLRVLNNYRSKFEVPVVIDYRTHQFKKGSWTANELFFLENAATIIGICLKMPAALSIFITSSHKIVSWFLGWTFVLHLLTPLAMDFHWYAFVSVQILQEIFSAPITIAMYSMWRDWASPAERTRLLVIAFSGIYLSIPFAPLYVYFAAYTTTRNCIYVTGACGLLWSLIWHVMVADTPSNDPLISEKEFSFLQSSIPAIVKKTSKLSEVPWKHILTSKPIYAITVVFFKASSLMMSLTIVSFILSFRANLRMNHLYFDILFPILFVLILLGATILMDFFSRKYPGKVSHLRKGFLCGAFTVHSIVLFGTLWNSIIIKIIFFGLSYAIAYAAIPGFITIPLDLSRRCVVIICGIIETFSSLGYFLYEYSTHGLLFANSEDIPFQWCFMFDAVLGLVAAAVFFWWGSAEEQPWSLNVCNQESVNLDYQCNPNPADGKDLNLVSD